MDYYRYFSIELNFNLIAKEDSLICIANVPKSDSRKPIRLTVIVFILPFGFTRLSNLRVTIA